MIYKNPKLKCMVEGYNYANFLVHPTKIIVSVFNSQANPMICNDF